MGIQNAMNSGVTGLAAEGEALGVVGDNVSNSNTVGFKQSRAVFEDLVAGAMGTGSGVRMVKAQQIFAQGTISNTGNSTDLALQGDGFFVVNGNIDGNVGNFYTRAGQTTLSQDGTLVTPQGLKVQGYKALPGGGFSPALGPIQLGTAALPPKPTNSLSITANLDANATTPTGAWDPQNPTATSSTSTSMRIYDSLGTAHEVNVYFRKTGAGAWEYHALAAGGEVTGGTPGQNTELAAGTLAFNTQGAMQSTAVTAGGIANFVGAAPGQALAFDFGTSIAAGGTGLGGTTNFASASNVSAQSQDGYAAGDLTGVKVDADGTVKGVYTNGQQLEVAKLAIAKFRSNDGLGRIGHNMWVATKESGEAAIGAAGSGGRAGVISGALEQSTVDITAQFVDMIKHQRSFQANSKTITTANEMLEAVVNLKR